MCTPIPTQSSRTFFPVQALNHNVTDFLSRVSSANLVGSLKNGLQNAIVFFDQGTRRTGFGYIQPLSDGTAQVFLSAAWCQQLWLFADMMLKRLDLATHLIVAENSNCDVNTLRGSVKAMMDMPHDIQVAICKKNDMPDEMTESYLSYLPSQYQLLDVEAVNASIRSDVELFNELNPNGAIRKLDMAKFGNIQLEGPYEQRVNALYCAAVGFTLLHEQSHFALGHFSQRIPFTFEADADVRAAQVIFDDVTDPLRRYTAFCGMLMLILYFLFLNPGLSHAANDPHPREDRRLFAIYDMLAGEKPRFHDKYTLLLVSTLDLWGQITTLQGFPTHNPDVRQHLSDICTFFHKH